MKAGANVNEAIAKVSGYLSLQVGSNVALIAPQDVESFERTLYSALLDQTVALIKHPPSRASSFRTRPGRKGDSPSTPTRSTWRSRTARSLSCWSTTSGRSIARRRRSWARNDGAVEVEHTADGASVETHVSGGSQTVAVLESFVRRGEEQNETDVDLTQAENEVLMALYSGVSPFQIPSFVGMDVEQVEEIFHCLIECGVLEGVRTRREVQLEARGRSVASDAMADQ